ncbi:MAG: DUF6261 family protein [Flavobacteriales bacterium]
MFISIDHRKLKNARFLQLMRFIEKLIMESGIEDLNAKHAEFKLKLDHLETRFKSSLKNPITAEIQTEDRNRDHTLLGVSKILEGYAYSTIPSEAKEAELLLNVIKNHGSSIARLNNVEETAVLTSLVNEIEASNNLMNAVNVLGIQDWITRLKTYNQNCELLLKERADSLSDDISVKELRLQIFGIYKSITSETSAHIILNTSEDYEALKENINKYISEFEA